MPRKGEKFSFIFRKLSLSTLTIQEWTGYLKSQREDSPIHRRWQPRFPPYGTTTLFPCTACLALFHCLSDGIMLFTQGNYSWDEHFVFFFWPVWSFMFSNQMSVCNLPQAPACSRRNRAPHLLHLVVHAQGATHRPCTRVVPFSRSIWWWRNPSQSSPLHHYTTAMVQCSGVVLIMSCMRWTLDWIFHWSMAAISFLSCYCFYARGTIWWLWFFHNSRLLSSTRPTLCTHTRSNLHPHHPMKCRSCFLLAVSVSQDQILIRTRRISVHVFLPRLLPKRGN